MVRGAARRLVPRTIRGVVVAAALDRMLDRIRRRVGDRRDVSTGLAHDLRTPLARIRTKLEQAEHQAETPAQRALLAGAIADCDDLLRLFASLLALAEIDGQAIRARFSPVQLVAAVADIAEAHRPAFEDAGRTLQLELSPVNVVGDRPLLQQAIGNLLDNALIHAGSGTAVTVVVRREGRSAIVEVRDDGPGIAPADRERIFDRLVRLDRSGSTPGHGLGLSIVAAVARAHGGTARAMPTVRGLTVVLTIPAIEPGADPASG